MSKSRSLLLVAIIAALAMIACAASNPPLEGLEGFDEDEPTPPQVTTSSSSSSSGSNGGADPYQAADASKAGADQASSPKAEASPALGRFSPAEPTNYYIEGGCAVLLVIFLGTIFMGGRTNRQIAEAWAKKFALPGEQADQSPELHCMDEVTVHGAALKWEQATH